LREVLKAVERELAAGSIESPAVEAERLLSSVLGFERPHLALEGSAMLPAEAAPRLARLLKRRLDGEPLQYLEGTVAFRTLDLVADRRALIPRPETEQLVEFVRQWATGRETPAGGVRVVRRRTPESRVPLVKSALDIGTGSGAIALSLAAEDISGRVVGIDISSPALEQAIENRSRVQLDARVEFRKADEDPFACLDPAERFELIVSNPPYVSDAELAGLPVEIRDFEPPEALRGGADGLALIRCIARRAADFLEPDGALWLETGSGQAADVMDLLSDTEKWARIEAYDDLAGHTRFISAVPG
jgi:release factor glutamine methyltransferase